MKGKSITSQFRDACKTGDLKKVKYLLARSKKINVKYLNAMYTLNFAVMDGYSNIVKLLVDMGANVNKGDSYYECRPLHDACRKGYLKIAEILVENGADIDATTYFSNSTPLHYAAIKQNYEIIKLLFENGCKTEIRNKQNVTALELAMDRGYIDVVKVIAFHNK